MSHPIREYNLRIAAMSFLKVNGGTAVYGRLGRSGINGGRD